MTIVAAVKSRDCLVMGTDSVTQVLQVPEGGKKATFLKSYANATKLFRLGDEDIAIATWGSGNIGARSVGGLILDYAASLDDVPSTIGEVAARLEEYVLPVYRASFSEMPAKDQPVLGFLVGGFSSGQPLSELWEVRFPGGKSGSKRTRPVRQQDEFGANWRGIEIPFARLHLGYDPRLLPKLVSVGIPEDTVRETLRGFETPVVFDSMPIQDAIDFARHILRTTIAVSTFEVGVPACGEPLQMAVVLRRKGFQWVDEPRFHV